MVHRILQITAACAAVCLLLLAGCAAAPARSLLWYQETLVSAEIADGTCAWRVAPTPDGWSVTLHMEEGDAVFALGSAGCSVSCGGVTIPVGEAMTSGARRAAALFSLAPEALCEVRTDEGDGTVRARFRTETAQIVLGLRADGLPVYFEETTARGTVRWLVLAVDTGT